MHQSIGNVQESGHGRDTNLKMNNSTQDISCQYVGKIWANASFKVALFGRRHSKGIVTTASLLARIHCERSTYLLVQLPNWWSQVLKPPTWQVLQVQFWLRDLPPRHPSDRNRQWGLTLDSLTNTKHTPVRLFVWGWTLYFGFTWFLIAVSHNTC